MSNPLDFFANDKPKRPNSFLDQALNALEASNSGPAEGALICAVQALAWATLSVAEEVSRVR